MTHEPKSITTARWFKLQKPFGQLTPDIWDVCVGNGQHLAWDRCWAYVLSHNLSGREISIVWAIAYAVKSACEQRAGEQIRAAYEEGWYDACNDHLMQDRDATYPIGTGKKTDPDALEETR